MERTIELFMGEHLDVPYQLFFKNEPIIVLYITSQIESDLCQILQLKNPFDLGSRLVSMIKKESIKVKINEEESSLTLIYNEYILCGKVYPYKNGPYISMLHKI